MSAFDGILSDLAKLEKLKERLQELESMPEADAEDKKEIDDLRSRIEVADQVSWVQSGVPVGSEHHSDEPISHYWVVNGRPREKAKMRGITVKQNEGGAWEMTDHFPWWSGGSDDMTPLEKAAGGQSIVQLVLLRFEKVLFGT